MGTPESPGEASGFYPQCSTPDLPFQSFFPPLLNQISAPVTSSRPPFPLGPARNSTGHL